MNGPEHLVRRLTVSQICLLRRAMGPETFRRWIAAYQSGEAKETVGELMELIDDVGEEAFHQLVSAELSAPPNPDPNDAQIVPLVNGETSVGSSQMDAQASPESVTIEPTPPNNETGAGGGQIDQLIPANPVMAEPVPPNFAPPAVPAALLDAGPQIDPQLLQQLLAGLMQPQAAVQNMPDWVTVSEWTDFDLVMGPDGTIHQRPHRAEQPAVPIASAGAVDPSVDAMAVPPTPMDRQSSSCERCREEVAGDYPSRRAHVIERHAFQPEATELAFQEALKNAIGECFPQSVVRNDLMCNYPGCGMEVTLYKGRSVVELQHGHVQQHHLREVDEDICPLHCPVRGCEKWGGARRDSHRLTKHVYKVHKRGGNAMSEEDEAAYEQLLERLKTATRDSLRQFFPHTPSGLLCFGIGDRRRGDEPRTAIIETRLHHYDSVSRDALASVEEELEVDCGECGDVVSGSYLERRQHAIGKHMEGGKLPRGSLVEQQDTLKMAMLRCFPNSVVANDLMCNRCGMEVKDLSGRTVHQLQNYHVQQHHFDSVEEGAKIECPIADCSKTHYPIPHARALSIHVTLRHCGVRKLATADKRHYKQLCARVKKTTEELLPTCFPITPSGYLTRKRSAPVAAADDEELRQLAID